MVRDAKKKLRGRLGLGLGVGLGLDFGIRIGPWWIVDKDRDTYRDRDIDEGRNENSEDTTLDFVEEFWYCREPSFARHTSVRDTVKIRVRVRVRGGSRVRVYLSRVYLSTTTTLHFLQ